MHLPKEPFRLTAANHADAGDSLAETDALTFFEEEILSPIQHLVRIFTLYGTGQCELRGHVGNLFQWSAVCARHPGSRWRHEDVADQTVQQGPAQEAASAVSRLAASPGTRTGSTVSSGGGRRLCSFASRRFNSRGICRFCEPRQLGAICKHGGRCRAGGVGGPGSAAAGLEKDREEVVCHVAVDAIGVAVGVEGAGSARTPGERQRRRSHAENVGQPQAKVG